MRLNFLLLSIGSRLGLFLCFAIANACAAAPFREYSMGDEIETNHISVAAVYLPPVTMDMPGHDEADVEKIMETGKEKIHLEADIHASKGNAQGFAAGEWIPYLTVKFKLSHLDSGKTIDGVCLPMIAKDGPHYGATLRMMGVGKYKLAFQIEPPIATTFGRHTDRNTGVAPWWQPFAVNWEFEYKGLPR